MAPSATSNGRVVVMLGVDPASTHRGGISAVVDVYRQGGLFERWPIEYIGTTTSGPAHTKARIFVVAVWKFLGLIFAKRVALVHAHTASRSSFWRKSVFLLIARLARRPVLLHLHGGRFLEFYRQECGPIRRALVRLTLKSAYRIVVLSSRWKEIIESIAPQAKAVVVANPVQVANQLGSRAPTNRILFLGRLSEAKGFFDLLEAIALVKRAGVRFQLRCGGHGDAKVVRNELRRLGIEDAVVLLGWVEGEAKDKEIEQAVVFVLPSYIEGLPMGVLEAMAAGVPVVATSVGGIPDAIDDEHTGFLISPGDIQALADRLIRLLSEPDLRERFSVEGHARALALFSIEHVLDRVDEIYRAAGAEPRARILPAGIDSASRTKCEA